MRSPCLRAAEGALRLLIIAVWITGCGRPTPPAPTATFVVERTALPAPTTPPTATPSPAPAPTAALPVRLQGDYPRPGERLGASAVQTVVELARWGTGTLNQVMLAPDGGTLLAATTAGFALYDLPDLRQRVVRPTPESVIAAAFSSDGSRLVIAGDGFVQLLEPADGTLIESYPTGLEWLNGDQLVAVSADGTGWAMLGVNGVQIRDLNDGQVLREIALTTDPQARLAGVRFRADGSLIVIESGPNARIHKLDPATGQVAFSAAMGPVTQWALSDQFAATWITGPEEPLVVRDLETGEPVGSVSLDAPVFELRFSPNGTTLVAAIGDALCAWALPAVREMGCLPTRPDTRRVDFNSQGDVLVMALDGRTVSAYDLQTQALVSTLARTGDAAQRTFRQVLVADQGLLLAANSSSLIELWDEASGSLLGMMRGYDSPRDYRNVTLLPQGQTALPTSLPGDGLVLGNLYQRALVFDLGTGAATDLGNGLSFSQAAVSADGSTAAYQSGLDLMLAQRGQARVLATMASYTDFTNLALSSDGRWLAAAYRWKDTNGLYLWDAQQGVQVGEIAFEGQWYENRVAAMSFSPDSRGLAVVFESGVDERVSIYDVSDPAEPVNTMSAGAGAVGIVRSLTYTPDGAHLVLGRQDGTILFLSTSDYRSPGLTFATHRLPAAMRFLDDGRVLAIVGDDDLLHLWGVAPETGALAAQPPATPGPGPGQATVVALAGTPYRPPTRSLDADTAGALQTLARWGEGEARALAVAPDGRSAALGTSLGITLYTLPELRPTRQIETGGRIRQILVSPDGSRVAGELLVDGEARIGVWDTQTGNQLFATEALPQSEFIGYEPALRFDFAPDSGALAFLADGEIHLADLDRGEVTQRIAFQIGARPRGLRYTDQGRQLVLVGAGTTAPTGLSWIDVARGAYLPVPAIPDDPVVAFDPSGTRVAVVLQDEGAATPAIVFLNAADGTISEPPLTPSGPVIALAFAPDGKRLASLTETGELCLWAVPGTTPVACRANALLGALPLLRFTPDGTGVIGATFGQVLAWSAPELAPLATLPQVATAVRAYEGLGQPNGVLALVESGLALMTFEPQQLLRHIAPGAVADLAFAPDQATVFLSGAWGLDQIEIETGRSVWRMADGAGVLRLSDDGRLLAASRADGQVGLYRIPSDQPPLLLDGLRQPATGLALLQGDTVLIGWNAEEARLWSTVDGRTLPAPEPMPTALLEVVDGAGAGLEGAWIGLDDELVTGAWSINSGEQIGSNAVLKGASAGLQAATLQTDGGLVLLKRGGLTKLDALGRQVWEYPLASATRPIWATHGQTDRVAVAGRDGIIVVSGSGAFLGLVPGAADALALSADGQAVGLARGAQVEVWTTGARVADGYAYTRDIQGYGLSYLADARALQADLPAAPAVLWSNGVSHMALDPITGSTFGTVTGPGRPIAFAADAQTWVERTVPGSLIVHRGDEAAPLPAGQSGDVRDLALSADGARLVTVAWTGTASTLTIWDLARTTAVATLQEPGLFFERVALSATGQWLAASTGVNGNARLYDLSQPARPQLVATLTQSGATAVAFSPDDSLLALGDWRGMVTLIDARDPTRVLGTFRAHIAEIQALLFYPDGRILATAASDGTLRLWGP